MNESAKRRQDLLLQMQKSSHISSGFPAVHPRYGNVYHKLYSEKREQQLSNNSLIFRLFMAVLCFLLYLSIDTSNTETAQTYSSEITSYIRQSYDYEKMQEVWKDL